MIVEAELGERGATPGATDTKPPSNRKRRPCAAGAIDQGRENNADQSDRDRDGDRPPWPRVQVEARREFQLWRRRFHGASDHGNCQIAGVLAVVENRDDGNAETEQHERRERPAKRVTNTSFHAPKASPRKIA